MSDVEVPIEEQIRSLARRFGAVETKLESIDSKLESVDSRLGAMESRLGTMESRQGAMESRQGAMESRQDSMDSTLTSIDSKLDSISIKLDDTRQIAKLGLEAVQGMRESSERTHAEMRRDHDNQTDLLKSVLVHVGKRVERIEGPKRRRRS